VLRKLFTRDFDVWQGRVRNQIVNRWFAARWGRYTDSEEHDQHQYLYEPASWLVLRIALRGRAVGEGDSFIDIGCGKGRVLLQAARYPFRRVIGLDRSDRMLEIASHAIDHNRRRLTCNQVELVNADIRGYELPIDVGVVFCFPWQNAVSEVILDKVMALADARATSVLFIYYLPREHSVVEGSGRARLIKCVRPHPVVHAYPLNVYEIMPLGTGVTM
jgi:SAM-dependent methyltransferase